MAMKAFMEPMGTELVCEDPFDSIDDLLDFPNDDDGLPMVDAWGNCAPLAPPPAPAMIAVENGGKINVGGVANGLDGRASVSDDDGLGLYNDMDIANLEWLSNFFEDAELNFNLAPNSSPSTTPEIKPEHKTPSLSRSSSPISVLPSYSSSSSSPSSSSSSSSSSSPAHPPPASVPARARTKRPRPPSSSARTFIPPSSNTHHPSLLHKKIRTDLNSPPSLRKCTHCDIQKTPQWRAGPMGPKTLCNACGVRYKSGRLFPEYRPAASPTFVPAVHSNSHKKVVEMRLRCTHTTNGGREINNASPNNCDLLEYIRRAD